MIGYVFTGSVFISMICFKYQQTWHLEKPYSIFKHLVKSNRNKMTAVFKYAQYVEKLRFWS